jgi:L-ascorbate metabolism protein UlaG (beta-lactamase superfamily)
LDSNGSSNWNGGDSFCHRDWKVTFTPSKHWGARVLRDNHRGYGGFVLGTRGAECYHAGDSAYFEGFKEIGKVCQPEIALLPIGVLSPREFSSRAYGNPTKL